MRLSYVAPLLDITSIEPLFCDRISKSFSTASSDDTGTCSLPRITAVRLRRLGEFIICGRAKRPSGHIALSASSETIAPEIILPSFILSLILQCLGHSAQYETAVLSGSPNHLPHLSVRQPVGQASTHAPQKRHSSELQVRPNAEEIFARLPRFAIPIAGLPWIFSQTLKHLPHSMQRLWFLSIKGSFSSTFERSYIVGSPISRVYEPRATSRSSQPERFEHVPQRVAAVERVGILFSFSQSARESQTMHGDGWELIISSIVRLRWVSRFSEVVRTTIPSAAGVVHEVGVPLTPSISTTQRRHAP